MHRNTQKTASGGENTGLGKYPECESLPPRIPLHSTQSVLDRFALETLALSVRMLTRRADGSGLEPPCPPRRFAAYSPMAFALTLCSAPLALALRMLSLRACSSPIGMHAAIVWRVYAILFCGRLPYNWMGMVACKKSNQVRFEHVCFDIA